MTRLTAYHNYVVVRRELPSGGSDRVVLPEQVSDACIGIVDSLGPDVRVPLAVGDKVLVPPYGVGHAVRFEHVRYLILLDHEILGVIR